MPLRPSRSARRGSTISIGRPGRSRPARQLISSSSTGTSSTAPPVRSAMPSCWGRSSRVRSSIRRPRWRRSRDAPKRGVSLTIEVGALDLIAQADLVRGGAVTPLELVDAAIARIEAVNPQLNAVIRTLYDEARAAARDLSVAADDRRPLAGTPFLVKDLGAAMAGVPDTWGSRALRSHVPKRDSPLVSRYREAG